MRGAAVALLAATDHHHVLRGVTAHTGAAFSARQRSSRLPPFYWATPAGRVRPRRTVTGDGRGSITGWAGGGERLRRRA